MRFKGLDLNLLVALDMLLECRSTTEAARRLNVSQPTVSSSLARLRAYFKDDLLVNVGREMVPTPLSDELAPAISELLNIARFRIVRSDEFDPAISQRKFKLLASDYVFDVLLSHVLEETMKIAPSIAFEVGTMGPQGARLFQRGDIDLMITVDRFSFEGYPCELLFEDFDEIVCWENGRYAKGIDAPTFLSADFAKAIFGEERRPSVSDMHFAESGFDLHPSIYVPSFSSLPGAVCGTDRIAVMHHRHAEFYKRMYPLKSHPLPVEGAQIREVMQWHPLRRNDPGLTWLRQMLKDTASNIL